MKTEKTKIFSAICSDLSKYFTEITPTKEVEELCYYRDESGLEQSELNTFVVVDEYGLINNVPSNIEISVSVFNRNYNDFVSELNENILTFDKDVILGLLEAYFSHIYTNLLPTYRQLFSAQMEEKIDLLRQYKDAVCLIKNLTSTDNFLFDYYNDYRLSLTDTQQQAAETTKPQQPFRQFTDEQIDLLKSCFVATFKGVGNNINYFEENLLIDLQKNRTGKEYAEIALLIYRSDKFSKAHKGKPFANWYEMFCNLMEIERTKYKPSQLDTDNVKGEFYYL
jgi:hypothetical protein